MVHGFHIIVGAGCGDEACAAGGAGGFGGGAVGRDFESGTGGGGCVLRGAGGEPERGVVDLGMGPGVG